MYVAISLHTKFGAYCGQRREGKKNTREKLASGSRECLEKSERMSSPKHCAQLAHATHAGLFRCVPCERHQCRVHYCPIFA